MKIYSKFQDYYDSAMAYGVDDHVKWVRNTNEIELDCPHEGYEYRKAHDSAETFPFFNTEMFRQRPRGRFKGVECDWLFIGFCGKIYAPLRFHWYSHHRDVPYDNIHYAYSVEEIEKVLYQAEPSGDLVKQFRSKATDNYNWASGRPNMNARDVKSYFEQFQGKEDLSLFTELNTPIFVIEYGHRETHINTAPQLKQYDFARIMDPYTAYQEIEMFLGGVLGSGNPDVVEIADKYVAAGKGFDKWSFRTPPGGNPK